MRGEIILNKGVSAGTSCVCVAGDRPAILYCGMSANTFLFSARDPSINRYEFLDWTNNI